MLDFGASTSPIYAKLTPKPAHNVETTGTHAFVGAGFLGGSLWTNACLCATWSIGWRYNSLFFFREEFEEWAFDDTMRYSEDEACYTLSYTEEPHALIFTIETSETLTMKMAAPRIIAMNSLDIGVMLKWTSKVHNLGQILLQLSETFYNQALTNVVICLSQIGKALIFCTSAISGPLFLSVFRLAHLLRVM